MKKAICLILVAINLCFCLHSLCEQSFPLTGQSQKASVNVRKNTSTKSDRIYQLKKSEEVTVLSLEKDASGREWYCIRNKAGKKGYVLAEFITIQKEAGISDQTPDSITSDVENLSNQETCSHKSISSWKTDEDSRSVISGSVWLRKYCNKCGAIVDSTIKAIPLHDGKRFLFTPEEYCQRVELASGIVHKDTKVKVQIGDLENNEMAAVIYTKNGELLAGTYFSDDKDTLRINSKDKAEIAVMMTYFQGDDVEKITPLLLDLIITCDTSLGMSDAVALGKKLVLSSMSGEPYYQNGIGYAFGSNNGTYMLVISLLDK